MALAPETYLAAITRETGALASAAAANLEARVPSCPDWTVADLAYHVGDVYCSWRKLVEERRQTGHTGEMAHRPPDDELLGWVREESGKLVAALAVDPSIPVWTWAPQKDVAFVQRRMAHETIVHRADADLARGVIGPLDAALAADGVDEFLTWFLPGDPDELADPGETIHLHATDSGDEWLVRVAGGEATVTREHAKADAAARAPVADLLWLLWRRIPASGVDVVGDAAVLDRFLHRPALT
ncbi:MAG: maleylpyruvate isomerase family mycothiol-dependent enzyme [Actinobacteria bacterium]|nr:MAG: maleylpyruvate isomerase family mycothiol-dependent enzyme [Actinomycetota bacterium]